MSPRFNANIGLKSLRFRDAETTKATRDARADMKTVIKNYRDLLAHIENVTPEILYNSLLSTFRKSQNYCPKDTGAMRDSGYLEITQFRGKPTVEIGYGRGGNPIYTAAVHENMEWRHKAPTRAKWLQLALNEDATAIQERIVNYYGKIFG